MTKNCGSIVFIFLFCSCVRITYSDPDEIKTAGDPSKTESDGADGSNDHSIDNRFFDFNGLFNGLIPGINQGGTNINPGFNPQSNVQLQAQLQQSDTVEVITTIRKQQHIGASILQTAQGIVPMYPNQGNIQPQPFQNQGVPPNGNFNQQGSINNINQLGQSPNQGGSGQSPMGLNGNLISSGGNQFGQNGNFQNTVPQQNPGQSSLNQGPIQGQPSANQAKGSLINQQQPNYPQINQQNMNPSQTMHSNQNKNMNTVNDLNTSVSNQGSLQNQGLMPNPSLNVQNLNQGQVRNPHQDIQIKGSSPLAKDQNKPDFNINKGYNKDAIIFRDDENDY